MGTTSRAGQNRVGRLMLLVLSTMGSENIYIVVDAAVSKRDGLTMLSTVALLVEHCSGACDGYIPFEDNGDPMLMTSQSK